MTGEQKFQCIVKETEKARLVRINGIDLWIPKSAFMWLNQDNNTMLLHDWYAKDLLDEGALYSDDGKHKFVQWKFWQKNRPTALCVGLNPKVATNSPTIEKITSVLSRKGYGGFYMVNLFTVMTHSNTTEPLLDPERCGDMKQALGIIFAYAINASDVIFCWGTFDEAKERAQKVIDFFSEGKCFGKNQDGSPWHPMSLHYAGLTPDKVQLFNFREHTYTQNRYDRKEKKKKMEYNAKQFQLIPNENN